MNKYRKASLGAKLTMCSSTLRFLLCKIDEIENDTKYSIEDRHVKLKIIQEEISKVDVEIDNVKKEIRLLSQYNLN